MAGRDAAPAGVVRNCTPGRTPEQPRRLLSGRLGSGHRETRKRKDVAWRADWRGSLPLPRLLGAPAPSLGEGERDGLSRAPPKPGTEYAWRFDNRLGERPPMATQTAPHTPFCRLPGAQQPNRLVALEQVEQLTQRFSARRGQRRIARKHEPRVVARRADEL